MLNGIDVSSNNRGLNIQSVKADVVIVKATEGTTYVNPQFEKQAGDTLESGKLLGIYHYAHGNAVAEAEFFLKVIGDYVGKAVLVLDWETTAALAAGVGAAKKWLDYVYAKTGVKPLLYTGLSVENSYDWSAVVKGGYGLWVAQYNNYAIVNGFKPRSLYGHLKHWPTMAIFQYTSTGHLSGFSDNLDLDVFYGDKKAWQAYAKAKGHPTPAKPVAKPASTGIKWYWQKGTFTSAASQSIYLRTGPSSNASQIGSITRGQSVKYDAYAYVDGHVWIRQPRSGGYGYMATGTASGTRRTSSWGVFK